MHAYPFNLDSHGVSVYGFIDGDPIKYTLDTGATRSCVNSKFINKNTNITPYIGQLRAANNALLETKGIAECRIRILDLDVSTKFIIVDEVDFDCIIGNNFLIEHKITICFKSMTLNSDKSNETYNLNTIEEVSQRSTIFSLIDIENEKDTPPWPIICIDDVDINPNQGIFIKAACREKINKNQIAIELTNKLNTELLNNDKLIVVSWDFNEPHNPLLLINNSITRVSIKKFQKIGFAYEPDIINIFDKKIHNGKNSSPHIPSNQEYIDYLRLWSANGCEPFSDIANFTCDDDVVASLECSQDENTIEKQHSVDALDISPELSQDERNILKALLQEYIDVIYWSRDDYRQAKIKPVKFQLKDDIPVRDKLFHYSHSEKGAIKEIVTEFLKYGILEPSESSYKRFFKSRSGLAKN